MTLPEGRSFELSKGLLNGAIDIHVHAGPHLVSSPRRVDPIQAAIQAHEAGMRSIVFMDVFQMSCGTAWMVNRAVPEFRTYGGIILNTVFGGMNPRAVKTAIEYGDGARFVSFGAHSTHFQAAREGHVVGGRFVPLSALYTRFREEELDRSIRIPVAGEPCPELEEILRLIGSNPQVYMITGHVAVEEAIRLVELAKDRGVERMVVSSAVTKIATEEQLRHVANEGALVEYTLAAYTHTTTIPKTHYYVEREYASIDEGMEAAPSGGVRAAADQMKKLGPEHCVIATDFGVYTLPEPVEGLREFIACLLDLGMPVDDIRMLVKTNPERLLGLDR